MKASQLLVGSLYCAAAACLLVQSAAAQPPLAQIDDTFALQQTARQQQRTIDALDDESRRLRESLRHLNETGDAYSAQNAQLQAALSEQQREREQLLEQIAAASQTRLQIMPLLNQMLGALDRFISSDIPFDLPQRRQRLDAVRADLERPGVPLAERYRSVMDAWRAELNYAFEIRVSRQRVQLDRGAILADTLRVGRAAYYYLLADASEAGIWHSATATWQTLPKAQTRALAEAMKRSGAVQVDSLLRLPATAP